MKVAFQIVSKIQKKIQNIQKPLLLPFVSIKKYFLDEFKYYKRRIFSKNN